MWDTSILLHFDFSLFNLFCVVEKIKIWKQDIFVQEESLIVHKRLLHSFPSNQKFLLSMHYDFTFGVAHRLQRLINSQMMEFQSNF
jgi:hypothetical protein